MKSRMRRNLLHCRRPVQQRRLEVQDCLRLMRQIVLTARTCDSVWINAFLTECAR